MRKVVITLLLFSLLLSNGLVFAGSDEASFATSPGKWTVDLPTLPDSALLQLEVKNTSESTRIYTAEYWDYRVVDNPGDSSWVTEVTPEKLTIPPEGKGIVNIKIEVLAGTPDGEYTMYIKVTDDILSFEEPVTLKVRIGSGIPTHAYKIRPGFYKLTVDGVGEASKTLSITITNAGTFDSEYQIYPRIPDAPEKIDPTYTTGDLAWLSMNTDTISIASGASGEIPFTLTIPSEVDNGLYKVWVGVEDLGATGTVQIEYACKLLVTIDRIQSDPAIEASDSSSFGIRGRLVFALLSGICTIGGLIFVLFWLIPLIKLRRIKVKKND